MGISIQVPNATAGAVDHNVGNLDVLSLTDFGRILRPLNWGGSQTVTHSNFLGFIGLVLDHDNYDHTPGAENIADCFKTGDPLSGDDFQTVIPISRVINDGITQKSFGSFQNKGGGTGYPDDILINQTCWGVVNKDWAILQWTLLNVKNPTSDLTNVRFGLEVAISKVGGRYNLGGELYDDGDDVDGYDATNEVYWAQDTSDGTTLGFASAIISDPITHYYAEDYHADYSTQYVNFFNEDSWLYQRITASSQTATNGINPENITATVGWDGFDILAGKFRTVALVIAINNSFNNMITALKDAQNYYKNVATGFALTEFSDDSTTQRVEIYSIGRENTDLFTEGYKISVDGGSTFLPGNWNPQIIPTYEYSVFQVTGIPIPTDGGTIGLYQDFGGGNVVLVDGPFSYGQQGTVPDPLDGESVSRRFDASTATYTNEWLRSAPSTWGTHNIVGNILSAPHVVLNRVLFHPFTGDEEEGYVELMYRGMASINIENYKIVCDAIYTVPLGTDLDTTRRFFTLRQADMQSFFSPPAGNMDPSGDNVYLYDSNDNLLDMVGWSSSHTQGLYMSRVPDGNGTYRSYDDVTSQAAGWVFNNVPNLMITEFYADPSSATIELHNPRGGDKVLASRWSFSVESVGLTGTWSGGDPITSGGYTTFDMVTGNPGEEGDTISLYYNPGSGNNLIDEISYGTKGVAPDPLSGESTARCWDGTLQGYSNDWTRDPTHNFGFQNDVPPINPAPYIILNEVMFNPSAPNSGYIVIINLKQWTIDITDYSIVCDGIFMFPSYTISGRDTMLLTLNPSPFNMASTGDNVYLYDNNGQLLDMVGWNTPHNQGMSVRRVPDGFGTYQGYDDTSSTNAGWVFNSSLKVLMTEISDDESMQTQIEVYNPCYPLINFNTGFTFESDSTPSGSLNGAWWIQTANSGEYAVFNVTSGLDFEGDTISFYQNGKLIEKISYGQKGPVPDPLPNESMERYWDGSAYTDLWERNLTSGPTFGAQNDVPPPNLSPSVVLNEIMFNPGPSKDGVIELYLKTDAILDISDYKIVGDVEHIIPYGMKLTPGYRFYYLTQPMNASFFSSLNLSGDNIYLYDDNGSFLDMVGWSSPHKVNKSMRRLPDGNGTADGFDDTTSEAAGWVFNQTPSYVFVNIMEDQMKWGNPGYFVWYILDIINIQASADYIDVIVKSENGWQVELYEEDQITVLVDKESPPDGLPDTGLLSPWIPYRIWAKVYIPLPPGVEVENTTVFAQSSSNIFWIDSVSLKTSINPWVEPDAYIEDPPYPKTIYEKSAGVLGFVNETTITLSATGMSYSQYTGQDVLFILDSSASMSKNDPDPDKIPGNTPFPKRVEASWSYVNRLTIEDRGGYVDFDTVATLNVSLTKDFLYLKQDPINGLWCSDQSGGTEIYSALAVANQELVNNGDPNHIKVEILLTDAEISDIHDDLRSREEAEFAAANDIIIFTIGLNISWPGPPGGVDLLKYIADTTGGKYYSAPDASTLTAIFYQIHTIVNNIAGYHPNPGSEEVMTKFVLEQGIDYIDGTFQLGTGTFETDPNPDKITHNPTNTTLEWNWIFNNIKVGEYWIVRFDISSTVLGANVPVNLVPDSSITYKTADGVLIIKEFPLVTIKVLPKPMIGPLITNVTIEPGGVNITWSSIVGADQYEIYGGPSQTSLKLDLADVIDTVSAPQTWWLDTINLPVYDEYYYVIRAVDTDTIPITRSQTSNTGGYYTKQFGAGLNTFSLPLEPFANFDTDYYTNSMNADYIKYMDITTHTWLQHNLGDGNTNNTQMKLGEAYEVKFGSKTNYTFTGMPGAMINYDDDTSFLGFDPATEAKNLIVSVEPNGNVVLTWDEPAIMNPGDWYEVYYSNTRDGFFRTPGLHYDLACPAIYFGTNTTTIQGLGVNDPGSRLYFMVVPFNAGGIRGSGTYSIGIWTEEYLSEYDTFGIPLKLSNYQTADWYCDNIPDTVGINYYIYSEQRWGWHSTRMPAGAYDPILVMAEGYQISTSSATKFIFIGV